MPLTNRLAAYWAIICLLLCSAATARAEVDFRTLLAQLPNPAGDAGMICEEELDAPPSETLNPSDQAAPLIEDIQPSLELLIPPPIRPQTLQQPAPNSAETPAAPEPSILESSDEELSVEELSAQPPQVLQAPQPPVDFQQMFQQQNSRPTDVAMAYETSPPGIACGCSGPRHVCQAHRRPSLPPPATLESMYHTHPCYRDLWAGYEAERQRECDKLHKHLHGRCKCLQPRCQGCDPALHPHADCGHRH